MSACNIFFVDILCSFSTNFGGCTARIILQRLYAALHGTLASYHHDGLQESSGDAVACLPSPRAKACGGFLSIFPF
jgi:hypothetical protein